MHEKDIELTRLLLNRKEESEQKAAGLQQKLSAARKDLESVTESARQRDEYQDLLAKAAELLERQDLKIERPDYSTQEQAVADLESEFHEMEEEIENYRVLISELSERAPVLLEAALGGQEPSSLQEQLEQQSTGTVEDYEPAPEVVETAEFTDETPPEETIPEPSTAYPGLPEMDLESIVSDDLLAVFQLDAVKEKEAFTYGRGAVYIIETQSVFDHVNAYRFSDQDRSQNEINNRLASEFFALSTELSGSFHLVFNGDFSPDYDYSSRVAADYVEGGEPVPAEDLYGRILHLVEKYTGMLKTVCAVTADAELADLLDGKGVHLIPISEFFN